MHSQTKATLDRCHCIHTIKSEIKYINFYHCSVNLNFFDKKVSQNGIQSLHFKTLYVRLIGINSKNTYFL